MNVQRIAYKPKQGVLHYARELSNADPLQLVATEKFGASARLLDDLSKELGISTSRFLTIIGVPKAVIGRTPTLQGAGGAAALGIVKLLDIVQRIVDASTAVDAKQFNSAQWFGAWIEKPQPSLGGIKPSDILATPTGAALVARVLRAAESGVYL